ncbi:hypothetical protein LCGC14_2822600, partial [marine sediment metagenome]
EQQVIAALHDGYTTKSKLFGYLSARYTADGLRSAVNNLKWLGLLEEEDGYLIPVGKA